MSILNESNEEIGYLKVFIVPKAVGETGDYFYTLDGLTSVRIFFHIYGTYICLPPST